MRVQYTQQAEIFNLLSPEERVPAPRRCGPLQQCVDTALAIRNLFVLHQYYGLEDFTALDSHCLDAQGIPRPACILIEKQSAYASIATRIGP